MLWTESLAVISYESTRRFPVTEKCPAFIFIFRRINHEIAHLLDVNRLAVYPLALSCFAHGRTATYSATRTFSLGISSFKC